MSHLDAFDKCFAVFLTLCLTAAALLMGFGILTAFISEPGITSVVGITVIIMFRYIYPKVTRWIGDLDA